MKTIKVPSLSSVDRLHFGLRKHLGHQRPNKADSSLPPVYLQGNRTLGFDVSGVEQVTPNKCRCGRYPTIALLPNGGATIECERCGILLSGSDAIVQQWNVYQAAFPNRNDEPTVIMPFQPKSKTVPGHINMTTSHNVSPDEWYVVDDEKRIHRSQLPLFDLAINKQNPTITVVAVTDDYKLAEHVEAIKRTVAAVPFKVEQLLVSLERPAEFSGRWVKLPKRFDDVAAYSGFMIHNLPDLIETDFCLTDQWDGYTLHPDAWSDEFLKYDYIGAPFVGQPLLKWLFPRFYRRVGNGGFSLRSSRWLLLGKTVKNFNGEGEDRFCCRTAVKHWLRHGCRIAPMEVALRFSVEWRLLEFPDWNPEHSFGFHGCLPNGRRLYTEWPSRTKMIYRFGLGFLKLHIRNMVKMN